MGGVGFLTSIVLMVFSLATFSGMVAGALTRDWQAFEAFALLTLAYVILAIFAYLVSSGKKQNTNRSGVFAGVLVMWLTLVLAALPPFLILEK